MTSRNQITEFLVAADRADEDEDQTPEPVVVRLRTPSEDPDTDDDLYELTMHFPGDGQMAAWMATSASFAAQEERVAGTVNFFVSMLKEQDHAYIVARLYDRKDPFGTRDIMGLLHHAMEQWSGRPTKQPSGSTPSRRTGGPKSTRRSPALT
jgi:hypothetical protein